MTTTPTATLTSFLLDRIAEDESSARTAALTEGQREYLWDGFAKAGVAGLAERLVAGCHDPARAVAECEAHRRIVELHTDGETDPDYPWCETCSGEIHAVRWPCPTLRALASIYADHPEFQEAWR